MWSRNLRTGSVAFALFCVSLSGCKGKQAKPGKTADVTAVDRGSAASSPAVVAVVEDAGSGANPSRKDWTSQYSLPWIDAGKVVKLQVSNSAPLFDAVGPVVDGDVAIVGTSQLGFVAMRWRDGTIAWTKPAGLHLAPPIFKGEHWHLISECPRAIAEDQSQIILGCLRVVARNGSDVAFLAIVGEAKALSPFASATGTAQTWSIATSGGTIGWQRGDVAVAIDPVTGAAKPTDATAGHKYAEIKAKQMRFSLEDEKLVARNADAAEQWRIGDRFTALLSVVRGATHEAPMVRVARFSARFNPRGELDVLDVDATGSRHGQAAFPTPGIGLLGFHCNELGGCALAVRVDSTLQHDLVVGYSATGKQLWVHALPEIARADAVGVAVTKDATLVFHDGNSVTSLPGIN
jgi:hypothetical protein